MKIHILGICGTFMAGIATIAKQLGHSVQGCDAKVYPPMSTQLAEQGITLVEGFDPAQLAYEPDLILVGNTVKRGMPIVEYILNENLPYLSAPQWLYEEVLVDRWVLAVSGTHGKTTTSSMLAWILDYAGANPNFLIGGVPENFGVSARYTESDYFVIEADEYDTTFFDKRSKFLHYHPRTLIINNLEYDHADIFANLAAIQTQFHYLLRMLPSEGLLVVPDGDSAIHAVIEQGCWTPIERLGLDCKARLLIADGSSFEVSHGQGSARVNWSLLGQHNVHNGLAAIAAAQHVGIDLNTACEALCSFQNVKRRLEIKSVKSGITLYDDFAHHPTAIHTTLQGLRARLGPSATIIAVAELGSYTMRAGVHREALVPAFADANNTLVYIPRDTAWELPSTASLQVYHDVEEVLKALEPLLIEGTHIVLMSNRDFLGLQEKLINKLSHLPESSKT